MHSKNNKSRGFSRGNPKRTKTFKRVPTNENSLDIDGLTCVDSNQQRNINENEYKKKTNSVLLEMF
jgi:hypothetical protein